MSSEARSMAESFDRRTGSMCRMRKRLRCSLRETENHSLTTRMPERTHMRSRSRTSRMNSRYSFSSAKPITRSTPARLYQDRSNSTISPAAGRCCT